MMVNTPPRMDEKESGMRNSDGENPRIRAQSLWQAADRHQHGECKCEGNIHPPIRHTLREKARQGTRRHDTANLVMGIKMYTMGVLLKKAEKEKTSSINLHSAANLEVVVPKIFRASLATRGGGDRQKDA